jgi:C-terminal processing protease CtpA/Prc
MRTVFAFLLMGATVIAPAAIAVCAAQSSPAPQSPEAKAYLDRAITLFREQHINSAKMDWPELTQKAYAAAAGATTTAGTYPAIRLIIKELGEKHTSFMEPDQARARATGKASGKAAPPPLLLPEGMRLANGIGVIRLYDFAGPPDAGKLYAQTAQAKIGDMKAHGVCRFVLDLRADPGGNMYPMLEGVQALLEPGILGIFQNPQGKYGPWALKNGVVIELPFQNTLPTGSPGHKNMPVAVLIGPHTVSSGEFTAMSFEGRANTRFFGAPSGGYVTGNDVVPLADGAAIVMTSVYGLDRTGKKYTDRIEPDENTGAGGAALDAAVKWLSAQRCPTRARHAKSTRRH